MPSRLLSFIRSLTSSSLGQEARLLVLGLDNAGKTTILARLSDEETASVKPTQGFVVKSLKHENIRMNVWDVGGQKSIRPYWRNYFTDTDALVSRHSLSQCRAGNTACSTSVPPLFPCMRDSRFFRTCQRNLPGVLAS